MLEAGARPTPSRVLGSPAELFDLEDAWRDLAAKCAVSFFCTPEWILSWWETFGIGREAEVAVWEGGDGSVEAIVPLMKVKERFHPRMPFSVSAWTNLGSGLGAADHCGWPVAPYRVEDVRGWIADKARTTPMILRNLDPRIGVPFVPGSGRLLYRTACPRLAIPADGALGRSSKFRKRLRVYTRKLRDQGVSFRWVPPNEMNASILESLFRLHAMRQAMKGRSSIFDQRRREFHRRLVARGGNGHGPAALLAERDGMTIGVRYGFMWLDVFAGYQSGWDPEWGAFRLGTVMYSEAIRLSREAGVRVAEFLRGTEDWKYRFGAEDRIDETWLVPVGLPSRLLRLKYWIRERPGGKPGPRSSTDNG